ncbi:MAG: anhydro-N-acetylmuramic acid kinase [Chloroflexota bacterium]
MSVTQVQEQVKYSFMKIIGLMSGTSVDGIDVAVADIQGGLNAVTPLHIEQLAFDTIAWDDNIQRHILDISSEETTAAALCVANFALGEYFANATLDILEENNIQHNEIALVGSHGQTIWHDVRNGQVTSTLQIGEPSVIAARTGITTVGNFRVADVAVGGQGAPLTSIFDWLLLRPKPGLHGIQQGWRAVQNIGGIANVTLLPPTNLDDATVQPLAFDTGPGNMMLDWAVQTITDGKLQYDVDGDMAAAGHVHGALLEAWLDHPYFSQPLPKTTGRELFGQQLAWQWYQQAMQMQISNHDFMATLTELTAASIAHAYATHARATITEVIVSGGGTSNPTLMRRLAAQIHQQVGVHVVVSTHAEAVGIDDDAKEALVFALLAYLAVHGKPGNIPACTGAETTQVLGQISPGKNYDKVLRLIHENLYTAYRSGSF